jgi:hypothetical protein
MEEVSAGVGDMQGGIALEISQEETGRLCVDDAVLLNGLLDERCEETGLDGFQMGAGFNNAVHGI